jgi:hypothetical protein
MESILKLAAVYLGLGATADASWPSLVKLARAVYYYVVAAIAAKQFLHDQ